MLKVAFDGPDIREEQLYELLRVCILLFLTILILKFLLAVWQNI
jgi:hypothetical protein